MTTHPAAVSAGTIRARALAAADALPRTFPIGTFVAANPLHGLEHLPFEQAATAAAATMGASSYLSEQEYRDLYAGGRIREHELRRAVVQHWPDADRRPSLDDPDVELAVAALLSAPVAAVPSSQVWTRSEQLDLVPDTVVAERIDAAVARWCAAYLDRGQADWTLPRSRAGPVRLVAGARRA